MDCLGWVETSIPAGPLKRSPVQYLPPVPGYGCRRSGSIQRSSFPPHDGKDDRPIVGMTRRSSYLRMHGDFHDLTDLDGTLYLKIGEAKGDLGGLFQRFGLEDKVSAHQLLPLCKRTVCDHRFFTLNRFTTGKKRFSPFIPALFTQLTDPIEPFLHGSL